MEPENEIKKRFLILAIAILLIFVAISSTFSFENAYAFDDNEEYRPSYTWAEELGSDLATVGEIHERAIGDFHQWFSRKYGDIPDLPRALIGDIPVWSQAMTISDARRISRIEDDTQRELDGTISIAKQFIPFSNTMTWRIDQTLERSQHIIEDRIQKENLNSAFYQEQYQSAQFRIHDPILDFQEPSIDLQSYEPLESIQPPDFSDYQDMIEPIQPPYFSDYHNMIEPIPSLTDYIDNMSSYEMMDYMHSLEPDLTAMDRMDAVHRTLDLIESQNFSDYQDMIEPIDWPSQETVYRDHLFHNDIGRSFRQIQIHEPIQIEPMQIEPIRIEPIHIEPIRMPDF